MSDLQMLGIEPIRIGKTELERSLIYQIARRTLGVRHDPGAETIEIAYQGLGLRQQSLYFRLFKPRQKLLFAYAHTDEVLLFDMSVGAEEKVPVEVYDYRKIRAVNSGLNDSTMQIIQDLHQEPDEE